jgi:hypothetical protein
MPITAKGSNCADCAWHDPEAVKPARQSKDIPSTHLISDSSWVQI